jgi:hypothetical protein
MTMGPAPMIRIDEMSVRLGIPSRARGRGSAQKARPLPTISG